ncbi:helix-turn-helix transcriptional regulator [Amycolatopsis minnesotensis]|uniref:LuxR C-terminal-related transcriptional regulator n=1 Tax=Amycolatopsis minnesotensis TaxID=337894 RepID=A0ABP5C1R8_9PSEU
MDTDLPPGAFAPVRTVAILCATGVAAETFGSVRDAVSAALDRRAHDTRAAMAVHTGAARVRQGGAAAGAAVRRAERLLEAANPGQLLLSAPAVAALGEPPGGLVPHDLGVHLLRDLAAPERLFALSEADSGGVAPRSLSAVPHSLPIQFTTFVGRESELAGLRRLLAADRLVTLSGPGGCGKTRLAAQVAADLAERWLDGVWWVDLAPVTGAGVAELVAASAGVLVEPVGGPLASTVSHLRDRKTLLCLDNCEHVLDEAAEIAGALLRSCPEVTVLTTSREPLGVPGETLWRVPTLDADEAVALFAERASAVRPSFTVDSSGAAAVRTMCARLDGIPLALELAAAWLRTLTPQQIESGLDDRFALLVRGPRGVAARQQTLAASVDWSHGLLDEPDRIVLRRLAVFAGGCTLGAARSVCAGGTAGEGGVLDSLGRLVDKSLVFVEEHDGQARFRLLETIRDYAAAKLGEAGENDGARERHLDFYLSLAETAEPELDRDKDAWRALLQPEQENLRGALDWGLAAADPGRGRRLAAATAWLWNVHGRGHEGMAYLRRAADLVPDERSALQVRLLIGIAEVADTTAPLDHGAAERGLEIATELGDERLRARCLGLHALGRLFSDLAAAEKLALDAERAAEPGSVTRDSAMALRGIVLQLGDRATEADAVLAEAAEGLLRRADRGIAATVLACRSSIALYGGDLARARRFAEQAVEVAEPLADLHRVSSARGQLALVLGLSGNPDAGLELMEAFVRLVSGTNAFVPGVARIVGELRRWKGDFDDAVAWFERDVLPGAVYSSAIAQSGLAAALRGAGRVPEAAEAAERGLAVAKAVGMPRILADVLDQQGHLTAREDLDRAADRYHEALGLRVEHGLRTGYADSLDALATVHAGAGRTVDAVRLVAAADGAREEMGYPRCPAEQSTVDDLLAVAVAELGAPKTAELRAAAMPLDDAVAFARRTRGSRGRPSSGWASLTPTESQVVDLAVAGLNNPEIGSKLFMSRGTVKTHLSHVYAKLGVANRTELATAAAVRGG